MRVFCLLAVTCSTAAMAADFTPPPLAKPGEGACLSAQLIYELEGRPTPQCHASTIEETPTGIVAAWFAGTHEKNPDVGIRVAHFDGKDWSDSVEVADGVQPSGKRYPCWNPVLFQVKNGPLLLFYKVGPSPSQWWGMAMRSEDGGKSWSDPWKLGTDEKLGEGNPNLLGPVKNKPVALADGSILCASSSEHDGWRIHFELTKDHGKTWTVIGPIHDASKVDAIQPSVLFHGDKKLQILCRTKQGYVAESWSEDAGKTWGPVTLTKIPNPNSGTDAVTLEDGRQLLVYNHTQRGKRNRQMLNVAISNDGKTWKPVLTLENEKQRSEFSYPAVIQTSDGKVHTTYTWQRRTVKHVVLEPAKLK